MAVNEDPNFTVSITKNQTDLEGHYYADQRKIVFVGIGLLEGTIEGTLDGQTIPKTPFTATVEVETILIKDELKFSWGTEDFDVFETEADYIIELGTYRDTQLPDRVINFTLVVGGSVNDQDYHISSDLFEDPSKVVGVTFGYFDHYGGFDYQLRIQEDLIPEGVEHIHISVESNDTGVILPGELTIRINDAEDFDADGLSDEWEFYHFGDFSRDGTEDKDGDSFADLIEFQVNTDPKDKNEYPKRLIIQADDIITVNSSFRTIYGIDPETGNFEDLSAEVFIPSGVELYGWQVVGREGLSFSPFSTFGRLESWSEDAKEIIVVPRIYPTRKEVLDSCISDWFSDGHVSYSVDKVDFVSGGSSFRMDGERSDQGSLQCYLQGPGQVSFWWKTSGGDLRFYSDGSRLASTISDEWSEVVVDVPEGIHQYYIKLKLLSGSSSLEFSAHIDNFRTTANPRKIVASRHMFSYFDVENWDFSMIDPDDDPDRDGMGSFREYLHGRNPNLYESGYVDYLSSDVDLNNRLIQVDTILNYSGGDRRYYLVTTDDFLNFHRIPFWENRAIIHHPNLTIETEELDVFWKLRTKITYTVPDEAPIRFFFIESKAPNLY